MARLEAISRGLFYPTPENVYRRIVNHLIPAERDNKNTIRLLDPCAGDGVPAGFVAKSLNAESYGIELNSERTRQARTQMDHVLLGSAFGPRIQHGAFSILFLNPPYDSDDEDKRMEHYFLHNLTGPRPVLAPGGVLVFIVPRAILALSSYYLASFYTNHKVYRFPDPEYARFDQVVVMATRRQRVTPELKLSAWFKSLVDAELTPLPEFPEPGVGGLIVPTVPVAPNGITFAPASFDPEMALVDVRRHGVWADPNFREVIDPPADRRVRPLMPFRNGHRAIIVSSGLVNNVPLKHPTTGQVLLVKGRIEKIKVNTPTEEENTVIETERLNTTITTLDLKTGEIVTLDDKPEPELEAASQSQEA